MTGRFNDTITTPCGLLVVTPTLYMSDDYFGDPISVSKQIVSSVASGYNKRIAIELVEKQANAISISLDDNIPRRAEDVINTLIARYNDESINDKNRIADYTADFIDKRLRIIGSELDAVDRKISTYKKDNEMYDITAQATQSLTESSQFKTAGLSVENQISMAQYIRDYLLNDTKLRDLIPANVAITNVSISDQIKNYNELMLRRDKLAGNASSNSPVIQDFDSELAALRRAIIASLQSHISTLEIQLNNIRREESLARTRIASATRQSTELLDNTRQQRIKEELYLYLLNKREENELTKAIADNNARIIDPAYGSSTPVAPRSVIILFIALLFGLATPFGIIYLMEILDTTIRGRKDIEDKLSIPFLGDIPEYHGSTRQGSVVVRDNGRDSVSEAFRLIRSNLGFMSVKSGKLQIIMVTSSNPHAGKTFVTTNPGHDARPGRQEGGHRRPRPAPPHSLQTDGSARQPKRRLGLHLRNDRQPQRHRLPERPARESRHHLRRSATAQPGRNAPVGEVRRIHGRPAANATTTSSSTACPPWPWPTR